MLYVIALHKLDGSVKVWDSQQNLFSQEDEVRMFLRDYYGDLSYINYVISDQPLSVIIGKSFDAHFRVFKDKQDTSSLDNLLNDLDIDPFDD